MWRAAETAALKSTQSCGDRVCMRRDEPRGRKAQEIWRGLIFSPTGYIIYVSTWGRKGFDGGVEVR